MLSRSVVLRMGFEVFPAMLPSPRQLLGGRTRSLWDFIPPSRPALYFPIPRLGDQESFLQTGVPFQSYHSPKILPRPQPPQGVRRQDQSPFISPVNTT